MQLHKRFTTEQIKTVLSGYSQGNINLTEALELLSIKRSQFFVWLQKYRQNPKKFAVNYCRQVKPRITPKEEAKIKAALAEDHQLVANPAIPLKYYNYSAVKDRLASQGVLVSLPTIINRAKHYGYYIPRKKTKKVHDKEVITSAIGALVQHDASLHLWSPYAKEKWTLITSLDDYSRKLLYADLVASETTWAHITAAKQLILEYGVPLRYYVDSLRIFRFVAHGKSIWVNQTTHTDEVNPQWKQAVETAGVEVIFALLSPSQG